MRALLLIALLTLANLNSFGQTNFSRQQVLSDLEALHHSLVEAHYDIYAYTNPEAFEATYRELRQLVDRDSLSLMEVTNLYQRLTSKVNNGHTWIEFPAQAYFAYADNNGTLFPLELAFEDNKTLIRKNWSQQAGLKSGIEVLSINGTPIETILSKIYPQLSAERPYLKRAKLELYSFPRCYWQVYGQQAQFEVEVRHNGNTQTFTLQAVPAIKGYEALRTEVVNAEMKLDFYGKTAYLNPGSFGVELEHFKAFIDSSFTAIRDRKSENLVIDLRNNPGGDNALSDHLVSYIADRPFTWTSDFSLKTSRFLKQHIRKHYDTSQEFWKEALEHKDGEIYPYSFEACQPQPSHKRFEGQVYVLVNRQSYSQAAVTAAQIQDYGFGTIVGEETAEYPSLHASIFQFTLPETGIPVNVSKGYMVRVNGSRNQEGVIPDITIRDHLLDEKDEILDGLLQRLETDQRL